MAFGQVGPGERFFTLTTSSFICNKYSITVTSSPDHTQAGVFWDPVICAHPLAMIALYHITEEIIYIYQCH